MQLPSDGQAIFKPSKNHIEHNAEGAVKTPYWIHKGLGMLFDSGCDPRMGQLEKKGTAGAEKDCGLAVYAPNRRLRAKNAGTRTYRRFPNQTEFALERFIRHYLEVN